MEMFWIIAALFVGFWVFAAQKKKWNAEKKKSNRAFEEYKIAFEEYQIALDNLEREDTKRHRIDALEKGRACCSAYRKLGGNNGGITAVDEQSITNDINARTTD